MSPTYVRSYDHRFNMNDLINEDQICMDDMFPPFSTECEVIDMRSKIDQLTIDLHTQSLQLRIEKTKRQKLDMKFKRLKDDVM